MSNAGKWFTRKTECPHIYEYVGAFLVMIPDHQKGPFTLCVAECNNRFTAELLLKAITPTKEKRCCGESLPS